MRFTLGLWVALPLLANAGQREANPPALVFFGGGVTQAGVERTIREFEARENVHVARRYEACGVLLERIRAGDRCDLYMPCDQWFCAPIKDRIAGSILLSSADLVLVVPRGNPRGLQSIRDLARQRLQLGIGDPRISAMGLLTEKVLIEARLDRLVEPNIVLRAPLARDILPLLLEGKLDAAIVYNVSARPLADRLELIPIAETSRRAVQPLALLRDSPNPALALRLVEALRSAPARARMESVGFTWLDTGPR